MTLNLQSRSSLPHLLLILEWILLGVAALAQLLAAVIHINLTASILNGLGLMIFAGLRLIAPQRDITKLIYTSIEFGLVFLLGFVGNIPLPSLLFIVLVIRNCVLLEGRWRSLISGLAFLGYLLFLPRRMLQHNQLLQFLLKDNQIIAVLLASPLIFGLVILFLQLLVDAALKESQGREQLAVANARLRQYALRIEELATVQERNRIAREIHDSLGHSLTVFNIHLEAALRLLHSHPLEAEALLLEVKQLSARALQEVRQSVTTLRSEPLQGRSLAAAIADLVAEFHRSTTCLPAWVMQCDRPLSRELSTTIYRIVQESLTNICKYAAATEVQISIVQSDSALQVRIQDNGKGFVRSQNTTGFGLQGMQERTLALGGEFEVITAPGQGCLIRAVFNL